MIQIEIELVRWLQQWEALDDVFTSITELAHPVSAVTVVAPFLIFIGCKFFAMQLLLSWCVVENLNLLMKWLLQGDRPYWVDSTLRQFHTTCETGFGMPSGHVMSSALLVYMVLLQFTPKSKLSWFLAHFIIGVMSISRVFTASHYLSQTIIGWILGYYIALFTERWTHFSHRLDEELLIFGSLFSLANLAATGGVYGLLLAILHVDPLGSFAKARAGCLNTDSLHYTGSLVGDISRLHGVILGTTFAFACLPKLLRNGWHKYHLVQLIRLEVDIPPPPPGTGWDTSVSSKKGQGWSLSNARMDNNRVHNTGCSSSSSSSSSTRTSSLLSSSLSTRSSGGTPISTSSQGSRERDDSLPIRSDKNNFLLHGGIESILYGEEGGRIQEQQTAAAAAAAADRRGFGGYKGFTTTTTTSSSSSSSSSPAYSSVGYCFGEGLHKKEIITSTAGSSTTSSSVEEGIWENLETDGGGVEFHNKAVVGSTTSYPPYGCSCSTWTTVVTILVKAGVFAVVTRAALACCAIVLHASGAVEGSFGREVKGSRWVQGANQFIHSFIHVVMAVVVDVTIGQLGSISKNVTEEM